MIGFLISIHILVSIALIVIVLLQAGKGADLGATFGTGSSQSLFGAGGGGSFLGKLTAGAAIIFMLTSLSLAILSGKSGSSSIMPTTKPAAKTAPVPASPAQGKPVTPVPGKAPVVPMSPQQKPAK
jgi:preprotein translocase subunit SecG